MHPLHTPRDSRHKCLSAPHLYRSDTLLRLQNGAAEFLIPPARQPTHPYFHLSVALLEEKGGGGGWFVGGRGRIPCSIPANFLISFASMLCPKFPPLTYPPYSLCGSVPRPLPPLFSVVLAEGVKVKLEAPACLQQYTLTVFEQHLNVLSPHMKTQILLDFRGAFQSL